MKYEADGHNYHSLMNSQTEKAIIIMRYLLHAISGILVTGTYFRRSITVTQRAPIVKPSDPGSHKELSSSWFSD